MGERNIAMANGERGKTYLMVHGMGGNKSTRWQNLWEYGKEGFHGRSKISKTRNCCRETKIQLKSSLVRITMLSLAHILLNVA